MENQNQNILCNPQWITVIILFLTFVAICLYTWYTRKMAHSTVDTLNENLRPIVACELISGRNYYSLQQVKSTPALLYDTRCIVTNHSKYNLEVFVNLNLKMNGKAEKISDLYAGERAWPVTSFQSINGHFSIANILSLPELKSLTLDLEVNYRTDIGKTYRNSMQYWHFDFRERVWVNDIGVRT
jgi:hypothetical protein